MRPPSSRSLASSARSARLRVASCRCVGGASVAPRVAVRGPVFRRARVPWGRGPVDSVAPGSRGPSRDVLDSRSSDSRVRWTRASSTSPCCRDSRSSVRCSVASLSRRRSFRPARDPVLRIRDSSRPRSPGGRACPLDTLFADSRVAFALPAARISAWRYVRPALRRVRCPATPGPSAGHRALCRGSPDLRTSRRRRCRPASSPPESVLGGPSASRPVSGASRGVLRRAIEVGVLLGAVLSAGSSVRSVVGGPPSASSAARFSFAARRSSLSSRGPRGSGGPLVPTSWRGLPSSDSRPATTSGRGGFGSGRVGSVPPLWTISRTSSADLRRGRAVVGQRRPGRGRDAVLQARQLGALHVATAEPQVALLLQGRDRGLLLGAAATSGRGVGQRRLDGAQVLLGDRELLLGPAQRPVVVELGLKGGAPPLQHGTAILEGGDRRGDHGAPALGEPPPLVLGLREGVELAVHRGQRDGGALRPRVCSHPVRRRRTFRRGLRRRRLGLASVTAYPPARMPATPSSARACRRRGIGRRSRDPLDSVRGRRDLGGGGRPDRFGGGFVGVPGPRRAGPDGVAQPGQRVGERVRTVRLLDLHRRPAGPTGLRAVGGGAVAALRAPAVGRDPPVAPGQGASPSAVVHVCDPHRPTGTTDAKPPRSADPGPSRAPGPRTRAAGDGSTRRSPETAKPGRSRSAPARFHGYRRTQ